MNRKLTGLTFLAATSVAVAFFGAGCNDPTKPGEGLCGPCGGVLKGDYSVSGDAKLDGFFTAVGNLQNATASVQGDFEGNILALADVYGVVNAGGKFDATLVDKVVAAIKADFTANVAGSASIVYKPPQCSASVDVAVSAQAKCEAKAECTATVNPGQASVKCEGSCTGKCSGECTGTLSCAVKAPSIACTGSCEGACELTAAANCDGTCHGTCNGTCSAKDASGKCQGSCTGGTCEGSCEFKAAAKCDGKCNGTCLVEKGNAQCTADAECRGSCSADCSGGCEGSFTPPSASADCKASADCNAQASAQANASLSCTPPTLDYQFNFAASANASAQAAFSARLAELKVRGAAILQGAGKMSALVTGKVDGKVVFKVSPLDQITASVSDIANVDAIAKFEVPPGRLSCVLPALLEAGALLGEMPGKLQATVTAQASFVAGVTSKI